LRASMKKKDFAREIRRKKEEETKCVVVK